MAQQGGRIDFQIGFKADKSGIQDLKKSLQDIQKIKPANFDGAKKDLQEVKSTVREVENALSKAFNPNINSINLKTFDNELKASGKTINDIYTSFSKAGAQGQVAFSQMARSVLTTNQQLKETHSIINQMGTTFVNTVKWGIASSVMNTFTSSVQNAFTYVENLEKSLTNIRIVTGDSQQKMEQFADSANRAAQELGRSTMDYSKAALTFYQQGLDDEAVQARTEAVLKAQNITGAGSQMADYLTAVWNGYKVANEQAQIYVDKLAAVADSSASDMSQLAVAMSKVASTANNMGVSVDQLNAQIATVVATTRQAPEAVGTAFKTIYTRMNDIQAGTEDAQISLGNYSGKMAELGFNVLDATGHLRDTGQVMQEIGSRWGDLTKQQQIYLATTMGGQRQVNQLIALFDNWTTYSELLNTSLESEGTLAQKNSVYLESLGAKMEQLGAAGERVKASLIDSDSFKGVIDLLTTGTNLLGTFIESIGGGGTALLGLGGIATQVFSGVISKEINNAITNFQNMRYNIEQGKKEIALTQQFGQSQGYQQGAINEMLDAKRQMQEFYSVMSTEEREAYNAIIKQIGATKQQILLQQEKVNKAKEYEQALTNVAEDNQHTDFQGQKLIIAEDTDNITKSLEKIKKASSEKVKVELFDDIIQQTEELKFSLGELAEGQDLKGLFTDLENLTQQRNDLRKIKTGDFDNQEELNRLIKLEEKVGDVDKALEATQLKIKNRISQINETTKELSDNHTEMSVHVEGVEQAQKKLDDLKKSAKQAQQQMSQGLTVSNIVQGIGEIGRATSAMMALGNSVKLLFDDSIPPAEKFFKVVLSSAYAIPTLVTSFQKLKTITQAVSAVTLNASKVQAAKTAIEKAQVQVEKEATAVKAANTAATGAGAAAAGASAAATGTDTAAKTADTAATTALKEAQKALNIAMSANPLGKFLLVIGAVATAISIAKVAYDKFHMSIKQAGQAIDNFNQKAEQTKNTVKEYNTNIGNLNSAKEEWEELANRAGSYNTTIDNLTEDEKQRYFELSNLIAQYNEGAIVGYDEQGNAIIANNQALKETIQLLKEKRQEQINNTYSGKDFEQAQKGRQIYAKDANKQGDKFTNLAQNTSNNILDYLNSYGDDLDKEMESLRERLSAINDKGEEALLENREELISIFEKMQKAGLPEAYLSNGVTLDLLKKYSDKYSEDIKGALDGLNQDVIGVLQVAEKGQSSLFTKAEEAGLANMRGIISSYLEGYNKYNEDGSLKSVEEIAENVQKNIVEPLYNSLGKIGKSGESIYQELLKSISEDKELQESDFSNLKQQNQYIRQKIESFIQSNIDAFKNLTPQAKEQLQKIFASLYNLDDITIDFDTGKVEKQIDKKINALHDRVKQVVEKARGKGAAGLSNDVISQILPSNITDAELDYIMENLEAVYQKTGDLKQAISSLLDEGAALINLNTNLDTVGLLNKQAAGENLGEKEVEALKTGLDVLKSSYSDLQDAVEILNNQWLQGTSQYEDALRKVKGAILGTLVESVAQIENEEQRLQKQEEVNKSIINMISSMQDLQQAWLALDTEGQQNALMKVASSYESCKNEIQAYALALRGSDEPAKIAAANDLARATYAAELGQQYGIEAERISELADEYARLAAEGQAEYGGLDQNAELAADAATRYIRLNDAIADLQKNYDSMNSLLDAFASNSQNIADIIADNSDAYQSLKEDLAGIIDVSKDMMESQDWGDWISQNADLIRQAMEGSQEAIDRLRESASYQIDNVFDNINIDGLLSALDQGYNSVAEWANSLPEGKIEGDNLGFIQSLTDALNQAGYTADQIKNIFSGMEINVDLATPLADAGNEMIDIANQVGQQTQAGLMKSAIDVQTTSGTSTSQDTTEATQIDAQLDPVPGEVQIPTFAPTVSPWGVFYNSTGVESYPIKTYGVSIDTKPVEDTTVKETTATGIKVVGANKSAGGKVSHKNASGGNRKSSGGKGGGGKKGKKGGKKGGGKKGKSSTPKTPNVQKAVKDKQDRYHDVNLKLKETDNELKKIQSQQEKLTGPELLKNLDKQQKLLEKQVATYREKIQLEKQQRDELRKSLAKEGVLFDSNGNISNYSTALSKALADYNAVIAKYNKMSAEDQQKNKYLLDKAKQRYETIKANISRYDKIVSEEIPNLQESIQNALDKQTEINIQKFKIKVDLQLDLSQAERDFNQFKAKVKKQLRDDDVLGSANLNFSNLFTYYGKGYNVIRGLTDQIQNTLHEIDQIDKAGSSSIYGTDRASAVEDVKKYMEELMGNLEDVQDIVDDIKDSIYDAVDKAQKAFDTQRKQYEQISDLIDHNQKIIQLLYGDDAYKELEKYYSLQEKNNNKQLDFLRQQKDMWYSRMMTQQNRMNNLSKGSNEWKQANDRFEEYKQHWMDSLNDLNDQMQKSIENIIDKYSNAIDKIFNKLQNKLTNNKGFDHISEEWELINEQADMYLDQVNTMYEIDKLENAYKDAIKDNDGDLKAQKSLNDMMNQQLNYLRDKEKLTQYDVDRANALLQIEIKRLALQQQRQNKTKLRLRRDAQGNYTYQYTADEEENQQAEQDLADAQNSLYNMTKEAYKSNLDTYYDTTTEWQDKVKDVYKDTTLTVEEQQKKVALLNEYYGNIINGLTQDNEDLRKFMMEDTFNEMAKMYDTNVENFKAMANAEKEILMSDMIPYWQSGIQEMATSISNAGKDFLPLIQGTFVELNRTAKDYADALKEIQRNAATSFKELSAGVDKNIDRTNALLNANKQIINSYNNEISKVQEVIDKVQQLMSTYEKAKNEALAATQAAYRFEVLEAGKITGNTGNNSSTNTSKTSSTSGSTAAKNSGMTYKTSYEDLSSLLKKIYSSSSSYATGGYTGDWGEDGKIAVLHEKELVLNKNDTQNMLTAVNITRTLSNILSGFEANMETSSASNMLNQVSSINQSTNRQQFITINADFPSVKSQFEIEAAFDNLVNKASQFAFSNKR